MSNWRKRKDGRAYRKKQKNKLSIQSVLLSKSKFKNKAQVKKELKKRKLKTTKIETKPEWKFYRSRQTDPKKIRPSSFRTISAGTGIKLIMGRRK